MKAELVPGDDAAGEPLRKDASALQSRGLRSSNALEGPAAAGAANPASPSSPQNRLRLFQEDTFERAARRPLVALG
ncbi:MAG TPA: hypothetical protein VIG99_13310 [Myxococcaceae bacterium]|jgi:hypothetical protein